jgi:hypothetical protein
MNGRQQLIPIGGLLTVMGFAVYMVAQLGAQGATADFTNAAVAEVRNAQGQVILQGQFAASDEDDDDIERKATLKPTGIDADAGGEAEVEFDKSNPATQEVEFSVRGLQAQGMFTFVIDGQDVATAMADQKGNAEVEVEVTMPGTTTSR